MPYVNIPESRLAGTIAGLIGKMSGDLSTKVFDTIVDLEDKMLAEAYNRVYKGKATIGCKGLKPFRNGVNNVSKQVGGYSKRVGRFGKIPKVIIKVVPALKVILKILKSLPIPTSVPPGIGVPLALTNTYADILHLIKEMIVQLLDIARGIKGALEIGGTGGIQPLLDGINDSVKGIDNCISVISAECEIQKLPKEEQIASGFLEETPEGDIYISSKLIPLLLAGGDNDALEEANNLLGSINIDLGFELQPNDTLEEGQIIYKGYLLEIVKDPTSPKIAPRRNAVAKTLDEGVVVLRGPKSFASDTGVLIDEIKLQIDNLSTSLT